MKKSTVILLGLLLGVAALAAVSYLVPIDPASTGGPAANKTLPGPQVPLPTYTPPGEAPPLLVIEGEDPYGHSLTTADKVRVLSMLHHRKFDELEKYIGEFQDVFEADHRKERWPKTALFAFYVDDPRIEGLLDEWVTRSPKSFVPYAARGHYRSARGWRLRGHKFAKLTSAKQFEGMRKAHDEALVDFRFAVALRPRLVSVYAKMIDIYGARSDQTRAKQALDASLKACGDCFDSRRAYILKLLPRWGGSYEAMATFSRQAKAASEDRKLEVLRGFADWDRCRLARGDEDNERALEYCTSAVELGRYARFYNERAEVYAAMGAHEEALADSNEAVRLGGHVSQHYRSRAWVLSALGRNLEAARDMKTAVQISPGDADFAESAVWYVNRLMRLGWLRYQERDPAGAIKHYDLALTMDPRSVDLSNYRRLAQAAIDDPDAYAPIEAAPDGFDEMLALDHRLVEQRRYGEIVALWDQFIAKHKDDHRAYLERGGAYHHLGSPDESLRDVKKACKLGSQRGCQLAQKIEARKRR